MIPLQLTRGDEWRLGPATLKQNGEPVTNPEQYTITGAISWPGGSLVLNAGNGRVYFDGSAWIFIVQEADTLPVPLGRVSRLAAIMVSPAGVTTTSQPVTIEVRPP